MSVESETVPNAAHAPAEKKALWKLLNSQFGLWILSTVLVGLISFFYTSFQESNRVYSTDMNRMTKLRDEIGDRLWQLDQQVGSTLTLGDFARRVNPWGLDAPTGVYPELQNRSVRGMILELEGLSRKYQKKSDPTIVHLDNVMGTIKEVERMKVGYINMVFQNPKLADHAESYADLHNQLGSREVEFDSIDFTADGAAVVGALRQFIAPAPSGAAGQGHH